MSWEESDGSDWINEGANCIYCRGPYVELLYYVGGHAIVECGDCSRVYSTTGTFAIQAEIDDMPVIEFNEGALTLDEYDGDVNIFGGAPYGDGFSW